MNDLQGGEGMAHKKTYNAKELKTQHGDLIIEGPVSSDKLASYSFHEHRQPFDLRHNSIKRYLDCQFRRRKIILSRHRDTIVGYVTYLFPVRSNDGLKNQGWII